MNFKYITTTPPINGRIKEYCEDFIVSEVGVNYQTEVKYLPDKLLFEIDWDEIFLNKPEEADYLFLTLEKNNLATTVALSQIARFLHTSKKRIGYAGLKDKRALTSQRISLYLPDKERLKKFYFKTIKVYDPTWAKNRIDIGDLLENKFIVTIRKIKDLSISEIESITNTCLNQIQEKGLINYFGEQRFGGTREVTHRVGKLLMQNKYKEAILLYLTETNEHEIQELKNAREELSKDLDFGRHASSFPANSGYESAMLNHLAKHPEDYLGSIKVLPKSVQYLFIHAYQSYLFNELINIRLNRGYGLGRLDGDRVVNGTVQLPLFGFQSTFSDGLAGELEKELFEKEKINFDMFFNKDYSVLSSKGEWRDIKTKARDVKLIEVSDDERIGSEGLKKLIISFTLSKGNYATVLLRELIKQENIG